MVIVNAERLAASICRDSFYDFIQQFWDVVVPEDPIYNWHIKYIADELQRVGQRVIARQPKEYDLIINVPPGSTKSTICSIMFPMWLWINDPTIKSICGSYSSPLSLFLGSQSLRIAMSEKFQKLFPEVVLADESKGFFTTTAGGQRVSTSTGGSITGFHGHVLIPDDPINPKEAVSKAMLRSANEWFDHTLPSRKIDKAITPMILIMQRLHQTDPTGHLLDKRSGEAIRHICLPATLTDHVRPRSLRAFYKDGLFDPIRLPPKILKTSEAEMGAYAYAGQYLQTPIPQGGGMFRTDLFQIVSSPGRIGADVRYWDKAGSAGKGCFTVGVKMRRGADREYTVLDVVRGQWEAAERERVIKQTAQLDGKGVLIGVEQEPGSGGKESAQQTVKNLAGFRVRLDRPVGDKELRADPFAVQVNSGNVRLLNGPWVRAYLDELQFFPFSTFKDQVDGSSGAFAMLTKANMKVGAF